MVHGRTCTRLLLCACLYVLLVIYPFCVGGLVLEGLRASAAARVRRFCDRFVSMLHLLPPHLLHLLLCGLHVMYLLHSSCFGSVVHAYVDDVEYLAA